MYRQRLIRAFLGASNPRRAPNPFTGFDEKDNMPMCELPSHKPLHVVNMTLNLVHGRTLAWQQRKAEPFSVTRLHSGSCRLRYRTSALYGGRYLDNLEPISLGTAMTISGAAASPNMGYNSSPLLTIVMTLFNARLGWWLGNPRDKSDRWKRPGPRFGIRQFIDEAFGRNDDTNPWIYLSDGGHFDNLGLYEMVLRRCAVIVVSDGGADPLYAYEDLGNAVRKIRIDLGISISFPETMPRAFVRADATNRHCVVGQICYRAVDPGAKDGVIIYLKPSLTGDEPTDVLHYASTDANFPHQTTVDQFFDEPQFESYRRLGAHVVEMILKIGGDAVDKQARSEEERTTTPFDPNAEIDLAQFVARAKAYAELPEASTLQVSTAQKAG